MITQFFVDLGCGIAAFVVGLFPGWDPPSWMVSTPSTLTSLLQGFSDCGVWVDWGALGICLSAVLATYGVGFLIRVVRMAVGFIPLVGGNG